MRLEPNGRHIDFLVSFTAVVFILRFIQIFRVSFCSHKRLENGINYFFFLKAELVNSSVIYKAFYLYILEISLIRFLDTSVNSDQSSINFHPRLTLGLLGTTPTQTILYIIVSSTLGGIIFIQPLCVTVLTNLAKFR